MSAATRRVVITGANRGLGLALATQLVGRGNTVIATCREPEAAAALQALEPAWLFPLDVSSAESIDAFAGALVAEGQGVDVLINNAGIDATSLGIGDDERGVLDLAPEILLREVHINAVGPLLLTRALLPRLREGTRPLVMNVSSQLGSMEVGRHHARDIGYNVSKAAMNMITCALATHPDCAGVTCLTVHPGWVRTDMGGDQAPVSPAESAEGLVRIIDDAELGMSGSFLDYKGAVHPW